MANEEALGPRKTMFVIVIVVGCFAVLWPRILSPLLLSNSRDQLKPNQFDRDAGCCEVMFASEVAVLELLTEVCNSAVGADGKLSPYAAAECRRTVNETCGLDIAAFIMRSDNVGKTTKMLVDTMQSTNSSCLRENFGVNVWSMSPHIPVNSWLQQDTVKQERSPIRGAPHPALRERGRAIPAEAPTPPSRVPVPMPPHIRVRSSPLSVYFDLEIQPPPIPGMRPPLGSPGGPVAAPKSSMGFVMPIYTICIIVFFVYTLSKILFKRTGTVPYEEVAPDPQFRRRVFRDDSRSSPETKLVVTAISGLVAEVQQQMEASYAHNQQRQDVQDNNTRPYTNGTVHHNDNNAPVRIIASEYVERSKEKSPKPETQEPTPVPKEPTPEPREATPEPREFTPEPKETTLEPREPTPELRQPTPELKEPTPEPKEPTPEPKESTPELGPESAELSHDPESEKSEANHIGPNGDAFKYTAEYTYKESNLKKVTDDFLEEVKTKIEEEQQKSTPELLQEALQESDEEAEVEESEGEELEPEKSSVKVIGMEVSAHSLGGGACAAPPPPPAHPPRRPHEAADVKSIYLETEIPQQSKVLVADFTEDKSDAPQPARHAPSVVSGKMTLSLIQDAARDTPERDLESTLGDFTTASANTHDEKEEDQSEEELEEEIEVEEIEEEVDEEIEEDEGVEDDKDNKTKRDGK